MTPRERAQQALRRGLSVIPIPPPRPGAVKGQVGDGKTPAITQRDGIQYATRFPTEQELDAWFGTAPMNMAVISGRLSGIVIVDCDSDEAVDWVRHCLPYTPWQTRTWKGAHLWYRAPTGAVETRLNAVRHACSMSTLALDFRAEHALTMMPGSRHRMGVTYEELGDWTQSRDQLPVFDVAWLDRSTELTVFVRVCRGMEVGP